MDFEFSGMQSRSHSCQCILDTPPPQPPSFSPLSDTRARVWGRRDGASYATMYNNIKQEEPTYVVVESMNGEVFGGFAASAWSSGCQVGFCDGRFYVFSCYSCRYYLS